MRILITNTESWGNGSFTVARATLQMLRKMGHEALLFFPDTGLLNQELHYYYTHPELYHIWKFPIHHQGTSLFSPPLIIPEPHPRVIHERTFKDLSDQELKSYLHCLKIALKHVVKEFQPDIVECEHLWLMNTIIHELDIPYVCTAHHSDQIGFQYDKRIQSLITPSIQHARYIFAISQFVADEVLKLYPIERYKIQVIGNGYNQDVFKPLKRSKLDTLKKYQLNIPIDATIVTFAGILSKTKGVDILLKANQWLQQKNIHLILAGSGNINQCIASKEQQLLSFDNVHFIGQRTMEEIAELHQIADMATLPSRTEGFGIAALEAMGCGLPVIATHIEGLKEFVVGKLIAPCDAKALANAILEITYQSKEEKQQLSKQALKVAQTFSWETITKNRIQLYQKALNQNDIAA